MRFLKIFYIIVLGHAVLGGAGVWQGEGSKTGMYVAIAAALLLLRPFIFKLVRSIVRDVSAAVRKAFRNGIYGDDLDRVKTGR